MPATLAISWGSVTAVVTPCGSTAAAKLAGTQRLLSMCTWASIKPWRDIGAIEIAFFSGSVAGANARNQPAGHGNVGRFNLAREDIDQAHIAQKQLRRLITTRNRK